MAEATTHRWKFLTNHAQVLACIAHDPGVLLREISERVGITERAVHRIVTELAEVATSRESATDVATITRSNPAFRCPTAGRVQRISDLLTILIGTTDEFPNTPVLTPSKSSKAKTANERQHQ